MVQLKELRTNDRYEVVIYPVTKIVVNKWKKLEGLDVYDN